MLRDRFNGGIRHYVARARDRRFRHSSRRESASRTSNSGLSDLIILPPLPVNEIGFPKTCAVPRQGFTLLIKQYSPGSQL